MTTALDQLHALLGPAIEALDAGLELWGIEFVAGPASALLRVYIDAADRAVGIDDCELVSREISALLDVEDPIPGNYTLEVSSPGLDRPLFTPAQFERFAGEVVKVTLSLPVDNRRRGQGRVVRVDGDTIVLDVDGHEWAFAHDNIQKARLAPQFEPPAKPGGRQGRSRRKPDGTGAA